MKNSSDKFEKRRQRGQVSSRDIEPWSDAPVSRLLELLRSPNAQTRTIGATVIGNRRLNELVLPLCESLQTESRLYPRLAVSESLGKMGKPAVLPLIRLLGKIGHNQETCLPVKYFNKKSFPLPRDIAARTLTKLGSAAMPELTRTIVSHDGFDTQQAIDALGSIVNRTNDKSSLPALLGALENFSKNEITAWKIVRALSGFRFAESVQPLISVVQNRTEAAIRWEAIRSLGQVGIASSPLLEMLRRHANDGHSEIRKASKVAVEQLTKSVV